ncbi:MAG: nicotinate phosphoribosyltransferase [Candidatus Omnitrophota bacterium]|nr:MAG: nicotinate phosphoribosyltransferase [Candidatus Omnitrophota bacterium]
MNNISLLVDLYELTMAQSYFVYKKDSRATFDLFIRDLPPNRSYLICAGLEDILSYIKNLEFSKEDLKYLKKQKLFSNEFLNYLSKFRFRGDIWAMPEGTVFFANEPCLRVTASIIEAQIIESALLNTINLQTMIASKASRVVYAAGNKGVYDFSLRRTHGSDAAVKVSRASYIAGFKGTSNVLSAKLYNIPAVGTMAHSFVMAFKREIDSFLAYSSTFPDTTTLLVDTYNTKKGIKNAVLIALYLKEGGYRLKGIRLDSGDMAGLSKTARRILDKEGLGYVKIFASGNLDEFKIKNLLDRDALIDNFGVGTNMGTSIDAPSLDVIYKISEVTDSNGKFLPTMKLSSHKATYPGRKQVFRIENKKRKFVKDILGLDSEKIKGRALLKKVVDNGRVVYKSPSIEKIRAFTKENIEKFDNKLRHIYSEYKYPVLISPQLKKLRNTLHLDLEKRQ